MPYENVLYGIARRYALSVELGEKGAVEALGRVDEVNGLLRLDAQAVAPPICGADRALDIRGRVIEMVARIALTHNDDEIELRLLNGDLDGGLAVGHGCGADIDRVEIGRSVEFFDFKKIIEEDRENEIMDKSLLLVCMAK